MAYVIVEHVFDPEAAANELTQRGDDKRAAQVRERGEGTFIAPELARLSADRQTAEVALAKHAYDHGVSGLRFHLRTDFDPDWRIQNFAIEEALREVPALRGQSAVEAVNVFRRAYFGWDARHDITAPKDSEGWGQVNARNFADAAYLVGNALGGLHLVDAERVSPSALDAAVRLGWSTHVPVEGVDVSAENWLAISLGRTLRQCGEGDLDRLTEAIDAGWNGNS